jgi:imidazole glycerol-phosphate synthase subunit HisH
MKLGILDYNACNISSIYYAIYRLGLDPIIVRDKKDLKNIDKLIIPGVGAAKSCIEHLHKSGIFLEIENFLLSGKPILGICLGLQIFAKKLYEHGTSNGIGLIDGEVVPIANPNLFNIGWSNVVIKNGKDIPKKLVGTNSFYFCHSYYLKIKNKNEINNCIGFTKLNFDIPSLIIKDNFMGMQFHPEKSQKNGLKLIKYFIDWSPK